MNEFMKDRYGVDELTYALGGLGMVLALIGSLAHLKPLMWIAIAVVVLALLRAFSKNMDARRRENDAFTSFSARIPGLRSLVKRTGTSAGSAGSAAAGSARANTKASKDELERKARLAKQMWKKRKTSRFLTCPTCGQVLSVPKGKGKLRVTCPKCHTKMEVKS